MGLFNDDKKGKDKATIQPDAEQMQADAEIKAERERLDAERKTLDDERAEFQKEQAKQAKEATAAKLDSLAKEGKILPVAKSYLGPALGAIHDGADSCTVPNADAKGEDDATKEVSVTEAVLLSFEATGKAPEFTEAAAETDVTLSQPADADSASSWQVALSKTMEVMGFNVEQAHAYLVQTDGVAPTSKEAGAKVVSESFGP